MPHDLDPFSAPISKRRPLLGVTILLVEDSRFCSEAIRLMTIKSGARLRRADCVKSAHKHLALYRPDLVIVDLGLPDGSGVELTKELSDQNIAVLAVSGLVEDTIRAEAMAAGANGFLPKPIGNIEQFQNAIKAAIDGNLKVPGFVPGVVDASPQLDQQALRDDLDHIEGVLKDALPKRDIGRIAYCAQFVSSVAQTARDQELLSGTEAFFRGMERGNARVRDGQTMLEAVQQRLKATNRSILDGKNAASV